MELPWQLSPGRRVRTYKDKRKRAVSLFFSGLLHFVPVGNESTYQIGIVSEFTRYDLHTGKGMMPSLVGVLFNDGIILPDFLNQSRLLTDASANGHFLQIKQPVDVIQLDRNVQAEFIQRCLGIRIRWQSSEEFSAVYNLIASCFLPV